MRKRVVLAMILAVLAGCASEIKHTPNPAAVTDPKAKIQEAIKTQEVSVHKVEVTDEYFRSEILYPAGWWYGYGGGMDVKIIYYKNIASFDIYEKGGYYLINLYDKNQNYLYRMRVQQENVARDFINAIYAMKNRVR